MHISPAQNYALTILIYLDELKEARKERDEFKWALATRSDYAPERMFPEYFPSKEAASSDEMVEAESVDYSEVEWQSPTENAAEFERIMAELQKGQFTGDDLTEDATPTEPPQIEWSEWV